MPKRMHGVLCSFSLVGCIDRQAVAGAPEPFKQAERGPPGHPSGFNSNIKRDTTEREVPLNHWLRAGRE